MNYYKNVYYHYILYFIISIVIVIIIIIIMVIIIAILSPLVSLPYLLDRHGRYFKLDTYLLQLLCHMTSDVKFLHMFFFIYLFFVQKLQHSINLNSLGY